MRKKVSYGSLIGILVFVFLIGTSQAVEKMKIGSSTKTSPWYYLPILAAQDAGFWKENGIKAEWVSFRSGGSSIRAMAAGAVNILFTSATTAFRGQSRGVPLIIIAQLRSQNDFSVYVPTASQRKKPADLKGAKIGVSRKGGSEHAYGLAVSRALGVGNEVTFVSTGGIVSSIASLKTGAIDAVVLTPNNMLPLLAAGEVRILLNVVDYTAKPWVHTVVVARIPFVKEKPDTVRRATKAFLKGVDYTMDNPVWAKAKMKGIGGYDAKSLEFMFTRLKLVRGGKISRKGLTNVRNFLITYGIFGKKRPPTLDEIYTTKFLQ